ncbi:excisionase [Salmonella enterica subsp. enterica]|nr:excisionase [Salmonella enterica]ECC3377814.1 excisionase [Salmonella enterica subsp. enterica]ECE6306172.1 excisionase [Salmonella enterica subsp. salamae]EBO9780952.1 excisionase [Salmonella enterica]EBQ0857716.1 excisionase [Salmonella enterica]
MQTSADIVLLVPNDWVSEKVLIAVTGLKPGTITRARKESWLLGREYLHISPDGNPKPSSECMYNRKAVDQWIEAQKKNQPGTQKALKAVHSSMLLDVRRD